MTDKAISPLRQRLIEDMAIRRLSPKTQLHYIRHVERFADFLGRSADKATAEDVHRYQLWLASIGTTVPTVNVSATALRFFFKLTTPGNVTVVLGLDPRIDNRRWKMPRHRLGIAPMTPAERQVRHRAKLRQRGRTTPTSPAPRIPPRSRRWAAAVAALVNLQDQYRAWLDNLPPNLEGSRLAEKLQAIAELDLDELQTIDPPRGYGRD